MSLTHFNKKNKNTEMVDISNKNKSQRIAIAKGEMIINKSLYDYLLKNKKITNNLFNTSKISGVLAAKNTSNVIPLTHNIPIDYVDIKIELKNNTKTFTKKINAIFYGTFALRFFSLLAFIVLMKYFFIIYKIENNEINQFIFYVLGIEYVIAGMILSYGVILKLEKSTIKILIASFVRFVIEVLLIYFLLIEYGIMAAAVILLVARYTETVTTYLLIIRQGILNWTGFLLVIWALPVLYFLSKLLFAAS